MAAEVLAIARREDRILVADDRDVGEPVFRLRQPHAGMLSFRLDPTKLSVLLARLDDVLAHHHQRLHRFLVVTRNDVGERAS